jgi:hypothetical protein
MNKLLGKENSEGESLRKAGEKATNTRRENPDIQKLACRIREIRLSKGYTNSDFFAYGHGFSRSQYNRYENGENIKFSSLMKIIKVLV